MLLVSHGSHSAGWRRSLLAVEDAVRDELLRDRAIAGVRSAFMEYTEPSIATQLKAFDREQFTDVILVPLLLTVSSHSFDDIPTIVGVKRDALTSRQLPLEGIETYRPSARVAIAPLLDFPNVLGRNVVRRVSQLCGNPAEEGVVLVAYGDKEYEEEWKQLIDSIGEQLARELGIESVRHAWCGHLVSYKSEPTAAAIRDVLRSKKRAIVIPLLVGVDEMFQGKIIGGAVKSVGEKERVVYRPDAVLPDEDVNRWVVQISLELASKCGVRNAITPIE